MTFAHVTDILRVVGLANFNFQDDPIAMARGRAVHQACHYINIGKSFDWPSTPPTAVLGRIAAYEKFKRELHFEPAHSEYEVKNEVYQVQGRLDAHGGSDLGEILVDYKTGSVQRWVGYQTAAYQWMLHGGVKLNPCLRIGLELKENGDFKIESFRDPNDIKVFLAAVVVYSAIAQNGGRLWIPS